MGMNTRISKQGVATITISFEIHNTEELKTITGKLRSIPSVIDIERTVGG